MSVINGPSVHFKHSFIINNMIIIHENDYTLWHYNLSM